MRNTFGNNIAVTLFGESHGEEIGAVLDGIPAGIKLDYDFIAYQLSLREPFGNISTVRREKDDFRIVSGVRNGFTCGTPICILIKNRDIKSDDYLEIYEMPRPSHSDYSYYSKYGEYGVLPGGGHSSGRITAPLVAAGAIAISLLKAMNIRIGTHIKQIGDITDSDFNSYSEEIDKLNGLRFAVLDDNKASQMIEKIESFKSDFDSIGGILETAITGIEPGVGEPWFDTLEGMLSHGIFSIPAVKGVEFGLGFGFSGETASRVNDEYYYDSGAVKTKTNNNGGILGGISNGQPIVFRTVIKPTPTISREQNTVNLKAKENTKITVTGRHDPCIVHRARVVVDSFSALTVLDMLYSKYGFEGINNAIRTYRKNP